MLAFELKQVEIRTHFDYQTLKADLEIIERKVQALVKEVDFMLISHDADGAQRTMRIIEEWQFTYEEQITIITNLYGN